jgi:hypothetical protein
MPNSAREICPHIYENKLASICYQLGMTDRWHSSQEVMDCIKADRRDTSQGNTMKCKETVSPNQLKLHYPAY